MKKRSILSILLILLPLLAVIFHALPTAVVYRVYLGNGYVLERASGFDRTILEHGQLLPYLSGICICVSVIFGILHLKEANLKYTRRLHSVALVGAIMRNVGVEDLTMEGLLTTVLLICVFLIADSVVKKGPAL